MSKLNDPEAGAKINAALAGHNASAVGKFQQVVLSGRNFVVSEFEKQEPPLVKHAKIFYASCKGQLVSFVFVSSSAAQVGKMEESMKTLIFVGH